MDIRDNEITVLKKAAWLNAIVSFIWTSVPFIVTLATFATYVLIDENNVLDAQKAFVTLSYMNILRMPLSKTKKPSYLCTTGCSIWIVTKVNECFGYIYSIRHFFLQIYDVNVYTF